MSEPLCPQWICRRETPREIVECGVEHTERERAVLHTAQLNRRDAPLPLAYGAWIVVPLNSEARGIERLDAQADAERKARGR